MRKGKWFYEWSYKDKNCLAMTAYFHPDHIQFGFGFYLPFHLKLNLWLVTLVFWWKDMTNQEMIDALKIPVKE